MKQWQQLLSQPLFWLALALVIATIGMPATAPVFAHFFPDIDPPVYRISSFVTLFLSHAELVVVSSLTAACLGIGLGVFATLDVGREFRPMIVMLTGIGLTFPPAAVLALAVPLLGFGGWPTLLALSLYALLPIVENTIAGLENVPVAAKQAAEGLGFSPFQRLWRVELPLAAPIILAGVRVAVIVNIGTATIGSTMGAVTLGTPIIDGLVSQKLPYVIQGAVIVGLFAVLVDTAFARVAARLDRS